MNAKHITLISIVSAVLLANYVAWPKWTELKAAKGRESSLNQRLMTAQDFATSVESLPQSGVVLNTAPVALARFIESMLQSQPRYGLMISQMSPLNSRGAGMLSIEQALETDDISKRKIIRVAIKGVYASLNEWELFTQEELSPNKGIAIDGIKLAGNNFEMQVSIFTGD